MSPAASPGSLGAGGGDTSWEGGGGWLTQVAEEEEELETALKFSSRSDPYPGWGWPLRKGRAGAAGSLILERCPLDTEQR